MSSSGKINSLCFQRIGYNLCILTVICNIFLNLFLSFFREYSLSTPLNNVWHTVEFRGLSSQPHFVDMHSVINKLLRNYCITASCTGKACRFGERTKFNRTLFGTFDFKDTARKIFIFDKAFICCIIKYYCIIFQSIINPFFESLFCIDGSCRVVWRADINYIRFYVFIRHGEEIVCLICISKNNFSSCHNICIYINGIHGIRNKNCVILIK